MTSRHVIIHDQFLKYIHDVDQKKVLFNGYQNFAKNECCLDEILVEIFVLIKA